MYPLLGELPGVPPPRVEGGEFGVDGRRKGDALGLPKESGDGLKVGLFACVFEFIMSVNLSCLLYRGCHTIVVLA